MNNVRQLFIPESAMRAIERAGVQDDNPERKPPGGGGNGDTPLEARVSKLEDAAQDTRDRLVRIETRLETFAATFATKEDLSRVEGSIRADMHKEFTAQTWRIIGAMITFGTALTAAVFFIARNVK